MTAVDFYTNPHILTAWFKSSSVKLNKKTKNTTRTTTQPMTKTAMKKSNLTENLSLALVSSSSRSKSARHENAMQIVICKKKKMRKSWSYLEKKADHSLRSLYTDVALTFPAVYIFYYARSADFKRKWKICEQTIYDATTDFTAKLRLSNDCGNTILMTCG